MKNEPGYFGGAYCYESPVRFKKIGHSNPVTCVLNSCTSANIQPIQAVSAVRDLGISRISPLAPTVHWSLRHIPLRRIRMFSLAHGRIGDNITCLHRIAHGLSNLQCAAVIAASASSVFHHFAFNTPPPQYRCNNRRHRHAFGMLVIPSTC